jgi:rod shape-determining protein MreC
VFTGGVVGRVTEVYAYTAVVELISSPTLRLAGVVEGDSRPVSFQGGINPTLGPARAIIEFVPLDIFASPGAPKRLVTSGLGGVFPGGLTLGQVVKIEPSTDGLFKTGEVQLDPRLGELTEVTVLVPLNPQ